MISAADIRKAFLDYFARQGHSVVASSSLVPREDPSLLFTNAGMVQFKKVFLGQEVRDYSRAATSQKCLRVGGKHNDLENVGRTARHHTFFEMLGNFSFGDYFKAEAIAFAWEFLTKDLALDKNRLYATVFRTDDEAHSLWKKIAGLSDSRIFRLDEKDNFWSMGDTGPCGPCSEILYDQGEAMSCGPDCGIGTCDCDRYLEIWNLVFMQYDQLEPGRREPLPKPSIDTGMGLERVTAVCQGVHSNFSINLFKEIIDHAASLAKVEYGRDPEVDTALRVMADHGRAAAFMIADGILPSNEGRGYVLRRLIRRAYRFGRLIGLGEPFLFRVALDVVGRMADAYPELADNEAFMARVISEEEDRFSRTLDKGLTILEDEIGSGAKSIGGDFAFKLYDTYGFPLDIVKDAAEKRGLTVDEPGFVRLMAEQKAKAKAAWKGSGEADLATRFKVLYDQGVSSVFKGYETLTVKSRVTALLDADGAPTERLGLGEKGRCTAAVTPFYGESGGQVGDVGKILTPSGRAKVQNAVKPYPNLTVHEIEVLEGEILLDQEAELHVKEPARSAVQRNHTATHLLHAALRKVLGEHVKQAGSLVGPDRLRFDFTHITAMSPDEIAKVEEEVNKGVMKDVALAIAEMPIAQAQERGATALFGEKYGDVVRVVEAPGLSIELCGGTHCRATGQIGPFLIQSESGVAAGVRRIEAATGFNALTMIEAARREIAELAQTVKARPGELVKKAAALQAEIKALHKEMEQAVAKAAASGNPDPLAALTEVGGVKLVVAKVGAASVKALRDLMDDLRGKLPSGVAALCAEIDGKAALLVYVSKDLHGRFTAPALIKEPAALLGGSGGGRPDLAQAGGPEVGAVDAALDKIRELAAG